MVKTHSQRRNKSMLPRVWATARLVLKAPNAAAAKSKKSVQNDSYVKRQAIAKAQASALQKPPLDRNSARKRCSHSEPRRRRSRGKAMWMDAVACAPL